MIKILSDSAHLTHFYSPAPFLPRISGGKHQKSSSRVTQRSACSPQFLPTLVLIRVFFLSPPNRQKCEKARTTAHCISKHCMDICVPMANLLISPVRKTHQLLDRTNSQPIIFSHGKASNHSMCWKTTILCCFHYTGQLNVVPAAYIAGHHRKQDTRL